MKNGKLLKCITALACVATLGLGVMAGCKEQGCEHVYNWTVHEGDNSTCTTAGKKTGVCGLCGDVKEEALPIDENAHVFTGDWEITKPTEEAEGLATKTCTLNAGHKVEVTLPAVTLSGSGYNVKEFITVPTAAREGEMKLELANDLGAISFNVPLAKRKLDNVEDVVIVASNLAENVRQSEGYFTEKKGGSKNNFAYYFGDDYTRIDDEERDEQYFYSYDDEGKIFAMKKKLSDPNSTATVVTDPDEGYIKGFHYLSTNNISTFYGAEEGLGKIYETAVKARTLGNCVDYKESEPVKNPNGTVDVSFSYGYYEDGWFYRYKVDFSTFSDGTLRTLNVETETIRNYMFATEPDGTPLFYKEGDGYTDKFGIRHEHAAGDIIFGFEYPTSENGGPDYEVDKDGNFVYEQVDDEGRVIYTTVENGVTVYKAVTGGEIKEKVNEDGSLAGYEYITHYQQLSEKPNLHDVYLKDKYGMELLDSKGEKIKKIMAKGGYPVTEYYSDDHSEVNYRTVTFTQTKKVEGETVEPNKYDSNSRFIKDFDILNATVSGGGTIQFKDGTATLPTNVPVSLKIGNITPTTAGLTYDEIAGIYVVDQTGNRIKLKLDFSGSGSKYKILSYYDRNNDAIVVNSQYAGEVNFVFVTQSGKCEKEVKITFAKSAPQALTAKAWVYNVSEDGVPDYLEQAVSEESPVTVTVGQPLKFKAVALGNEAAYVSTDIYPTAQNGLTFIPVEEGSYEEWNVVATEAGEYTVKLPYYDGTTASESVYATFKLTVTPRQGVMEMLTGNTFTGSVLISNDKYTNPSTKTLTAAFGTDGKITITVAGNEIKYTYALDKDGVLTTAWESGIDSTVNPTYNFRFSVNKAGDLLLTHSTGMGNDTEDIVLTKVNAA